jgi:hypothetical protein
MQWLPKAVATDLTRAGEFNDFPILHRANKLHLRTGCDAKFFGNMSRHFLSLVLASGFAIVKIFFVKPIKMADRFLCNGE